jgi:hypothetical protein
LLAVLVACAATARGGEVDPLLPKETEQVFQFNVKQIVDSDVFKKNFLARIQKQMEKDEVKKQFELFGVDPLKDVEKITVGIAGKGPKDTQMMAVLRGKFDAERLFEGVQEHATRTPDKVSFEDVEDGGEKWKLVKVSADKDRPIYVSVANATTLVAGLDSKQVAAALTAAKKNDRPKLSKELTALVLKQDDKASVNYCSVVEGRMELDKVPEGAFDPVKAFGIDPDVLKKHLGAMSTIAFTVRLGKEVGVNVTAGMKDEDTAEEFGGQSSTLSKLIDAGKTFLPLLAGQQPKAKLFVDDLVKTTTTKVKGKDVTVLVTLTAAAIEALFREDEHSADR